MKEDIKEIKELVKENTKTLSEVKNDVGKIEVDVRHHIKRSDLHEVQIAKQSRAIQVLVIGAAMTAGAGLKYALPLLMKLIV